MRWARGLAGDDTDQSSVDSRPMKVEVRQSELTGVEPTCAWSASTRTSRCRPRSRRRRAPLAPRAPSRSCRWSIPDGSAPILVAGLGKREEADAERLRVAAALAAKEAGRLEAGSLAWALPEATTTRPAAEALVTGTILGAYRFDRFQSADPDDRGAGAPRVADAAGARRARRRRPRPPASTPRPRTAPATCRAPRPTSPRRASWRPAPRRSPPAPARSRSRSSAARRSSPRGWAGSPRSARAATRTRA